MGNIRSDVGSGRYKHGTEGIFVKSIAGMSGKHYIEKAIDMTDSMLQSTLSQMKDENIKNVNQIVDIISSKTNIIKGFNAEGKELKSETLKSTSSVERPSWETGIVKEYKTVSRGRNPFGKR